MAAMETGLQREPEAGHVSPEEEESSELVGEEIKSVEALGTETAGKAGSEVLESTEMSVCEEGKDSGTRGDVKLGPVATEGRM